MVGSPTSHSAIMARAFGIPLVMGLEGKLEQPIQTGDLLIIDGGLGMRSPGSGAVGHRRLLYATTQILQREKKQQLKGIVSFKPSRRTASDLELAANISSLKELDAALASGAKASACSGRSFCTWTGAGFRTEEEQFEVYRERRGEAGRQAVDHPDARHRRRQAAGLFRAAGGRQSVPRLPGDPVHAWIATTCSRPSCGRFCGPAIMAMSKSCIR